MLSEPAEGHDKPVSTGAVSDTAKVQSAVNASSSTQAATLSETYPMTAKVESVEASANGGLTVTFTDKWASELLPGSYVVTFKNVDSAAYVDVDYAEVTLTPDVDKMLASDTEIKVTLTIDGDEFYP